MGGVGLPELIVLLVVIVVVVASIWLSVKILKKAGYSPWWAVTMLVPLVNIIFVYVFAFSKWPALASAGSAITCPYCSASIPAQALKCQHCGEWITRQNAGEITPAG
ncbi:MAG: hypothetical protein KJ720_01755 [Proteobacteria bacterium]|nr:hypothetical protein [Pseudomonadota bacterium]MBU1451177.1 hypothetical protein [Pseudomonadota bacterium]MBU2469457.1 hypothetical protein [Pseudomonadota bacterium]MBU2517461.1 hypothetical protein [Pseudomonadota bacterium]